MNMLSYHSINSDHRHVNRLTCQLITDRVVNNSHKVANNDRETVFKMSSAGQRPWHALRDDEVNDVWLLQWRRRDPAGQTRFYYSAPKHSFTSAVYATANPSVRLSVTRRYCVKPRERRGMQSSPSGSPVSLFFWCQEWLVGDDLVQIKCQCKEVDPLWKQPSCTHFSPKLRNQNR